MSRKDETIEGFFEYLLAVDSVSRDSKFSPHIKPLKSNFWSDSEKDMKKKEEEKKEPTNITLDKNGLTISKPKNPDTETRNQNKIDISGIAELGEETVISDGFVEVLSERLGLTRLRENNEDLNEKTRLIYEETKSLNERMDYLDRGRDLSEEKMKDAVKDGVKEALRDLLKT